MSIVSLEEVKSHLNIETDTHDTVIENLVTQNEDVAETYCRRKFESDTYTEYYDGDGTTLLLLNQFPVTSITSIHDDTDLEYNSEDQISADDIILYGNAGKVVLKDTFFSEGSQNIKVIYVAGYSAATMPGDLKLAVIKLIIADYLEAVAGVNLVESDEVTYKPGYLRREAYNILGRYRRLDGV